MVFCITEQIVLMRLIRAKTVNYPLTVWFCLALLFSYGHREYRGLPDLILELQRANILVFKAKTMWWDVNNTIKIELLWQPISRKAAVRVGTFA
jgi:hypothetical protein